MIGELLFEASKRLQGYFLHRWLARYLTALVDDVQRLSAHDIGPDAHPHQEAAATTVFDGGSLHLRSLKYIFGLYSYIYLGHKKSNFFLANKGTFKHILYLRGFEYQTAVAAGSIGISTMTTSTTQFTSQLRHHLEEVDNNLIFKVLSPEELEWDTVGTSRYFHEDVKKLEQYARPSFYLNADHWQEDIVHIADQMDYFVVYVSSITDGILRELSMLEQPDRARRTTVVFDDAAIADKAHHIQLRQAARTRAHDELLWPENTDLSHTIGIQELRGRLAEKFLVVSPEEFFEGIDAHKIRIANATAPHAPEHVAAAIEFRFRPAIPGEKLAAIREFDKTLGSAIHQTILTKSITNLPWFFNCLQVRLLSALTLGEQKEAGLTFGIYASVIHAVARNTVHGTHSVDLADDQQNHLRKLLFLHLRFADQASSVLIRSGSTNEFRPYHERSIGRDAEVLEIAEQALNAFFSDAHLTQKPLLVLPATKEPERNEAQLDSDVRSAVLEQLSQVQDFARLRPDGTSDPENPPSAVDGTE